jgi:hypothetical protein
MANVRKPPKHWNAYRPSYSSPRRDQGRHDNYGKNGRNPNPIPLTPRYRSSYAYSDRDYDDRSDYDRSANYDSDTSSYSDGPELWSASLDALMGRTARAYDLVINYERDSEGGKRWSPRDIAHIHKTGKNLHGNIRALKAWERCHPDDRDYRLMDEDAKKVRNVCEVVQRLIQDTEKKSELEKVLEATVPLDVWLARGGPEALGVKEDGDGKVSDDKDKERQERGKMTSQSDLSLRC